jgi:hypothetical protein
MYRRVKINEDTEDKLLNDLRSLQSSPGLMLEQLTITSSMRPDIFFQGNQTVEDVMQEFKKLTIEPASQKRPLFFIREKLQIIFELQRKAKSIRFMLEKSHNQYGFLYYGTILYFHENGKDVMAAYAAEGAKEMKILHFQTLSFLELSQKMNTCR